MPSMSTPISSYTDTTTDTSTDRRRRRHTIIHRPDSAMGLLSEDEEQQEQQETFDRISGILSSLIQEANEAVHGQDRVLTPTPHHSRFTSSTIITDTSKIPRPYNNRKRPSITHVRNVSNSSSSSTTSSNLFSPPISATSISRSPSPINRKLRHVVLRPRSCPVINGRRSMTPIHKRNNSNLIDPITESFKRLDSSMALVDSLSRDLATPKQKNNSNHFTLLLLVPLLHIPHSLITMIFDFCTTNTPTSNNKSFSMSSMLFWACVFAITNLMVDQAAVIPKPLPTTKKNRRLSLPGTYAMTKKSSKVPATTKRSQKQTWIPATRSKLCLDTVKRRNSI